MTGHRNRITQVFPPNRQPETRKSAALGRVHEEKIRPQGASLVTALRLLPWLRILGVELYLSLLIYQIAIIVCQLALLRDLNQKLPRRAGIRLRCGTL